MTWVSVVCTGYTIQGMILWTKTLSTKNVLGFFMLDLLLLLKQVLLRKKSRQILFINFE